MVIVKPNILLHIEDEPDWRRMLHETLMYFHPEVIDAYGGSLKFVESSVLEELDLSDLEAEVTRITTEIGDDSTLVSVASAQIARTFLGRYLPCAIVSDTHFPLNGKRVVEWIQAHGFHDYAFIGLSGTPVESMDPGLKDWFAGSNARYFCKGDFLGSEAEIANQIIRNREDNIRRYLGRD